MRIHRLLTTGILRRGLVVATAAGPVFALGAVHAGTAGAVGAAARPDAAYSFTVNSTADSHDADPGDGVCADGQGRCTLRAAVEEADADPAGSTISISLPAGTYDLTLGTLAESANTIKITGVGTSTTLVEGNNSFSILRIASGVTAAVTGVTISGGNAGNSGYGGGVLTSGKTTVTSSVISGNTAVAGGGMANSGGTLTIEASTVSGNDATAYGGGGVQNGGLKNMAGSIKIVSSTITGNTASGDGGGILNGQNGHPAAAGAPAAAPRAYPRTPRAHPAGASPARAPYKLTVTVRQSKINNNTSDNAGGAIANDGGTVTVTGSTLRGNTCPDAIGGAIETYGPLTVTTSTVSGNSAKGGDGGAIDNYSGGVTGSVSVTQSTLSGNSATIGGAIDDSSAVNVTQSTLSGNSAQQGGGIEVDASSLTVVNSTLTANTTTMTGNGGAIQTYACGTGTVSYSTITGNSTALNLSCSDVQLTGTIVAASTGTANCIGSAPTESYGYNLDSGTSCGFSKSTDLNSTGPDLGPLANNGGPTKTELPQPGSPVVNAGGSSANGCPSTDQRGDPRPSGPACDIGSVEVQG
jgi:CSLREA domain-containing protein